MPASPPLAATRGAPAAPPRPAATRPCPSAPDGAGLPRGRRWIAAALCAAALLAAAAAIRYGRWHVVPKRFAEIEPGLFRSGQLLGGTLEDVVRDHGIRTVLRLNAMRRDDPRLLDEEETIRRLGLEGRFMGLVSRGTAPFDDLEAAADFIADPARRPLLFHCSAGVRRSSAVMAVYRLRRCGWGWDRTREELARFGITPGESPVLYAHLDRYCRERFPERRPEGGPAPQGG